MDRNHRRIIHGRSISGGLCEHQRLGAIGALDAARMMAFCSENAPNERTSMTLHALKAKARKMAIANGHRLNIWTTTEHHALTVCRDCGLAVAVTTRPRIGGTQMGGDVLSMHCGGLESALQALGIMPREY